MKKKFKTAIAMALSFALLASSNVAAYAANQEVTGTTTQSKDVPVSMNVESVYSISLPAIIELEKEYWDNPADCQTPCYVGNEKLNYEHYYAAEFSYGCAGKISTTEHIFVEPTIPCVLTGNTSGATLTLSLVYSGTDFNNYRPKTEWQYTEVGSCNYDGVSITNCNYATETIKIGVRESDMTSYERYTGNLTFNFGIRSN